MLSAFFSRIYSRAFWTGCRSSRHSEPSPSFSSSHSLLTEYPLLSVFLGENHTHEEILAMEGDQLPQAIPRDLRLAMSSRPASSRSKFPLILAIISSSRPSRLRVSMMSLLPSRKVVRLIIIKLTIISTVSPSKLFCIDDDIISGEYLNMLRALSSHRLDRFSSPEFSEGNLIIPVDRWTAGYWKLFSCASNHLANKDKLGMNCEKNRSQRKSETHEYSFSAFKNTSVEQLVSSPQ